MSYSNRTNSRKISKKNRNQSLANINSSLSIPKIWEIPSANEAPIRPPPFEKKGIKPSISTRNLIISKANSNLSASSVTFSPFLFNGPITNILAKTQYLNSLTSFELNEIDDFPEIYYFGEPSTKIHPRSNLPPSTFFDDTSHHLRAIPGAHIAFRYEIQSIIGKGAFSQVLKCIDHKTKQSVAIKVIINTEEMFEQGQFELEILNHLNLEDNNYNIVQVFDHFNFRSHICIVFEVLGLNLYEYCKLQNHRKLIIKQIKLISTQILTALLYCHSKGIVHCDIKPENIVFQSDNNLLCKLIDFGSSCFIGHERFEYVQSRFYRAPEVILGCRYGTSADIWGLGCVITELITGHSLFPGQTEIEMLEMFIEVIGQPPLDLIENSKKKKEFFNLDGTLKLELINNKKINNSFEGLTKINDNLLLDFLKKCFEWKPLNRINAEEALKHPWIINDNN